MKRHGRFASLNLAGLLLVLALAALLVPASALAATAHEYKSSFGPDCTAGTHFEHPGAVAVDPETHDIYVADQGQFSREVFRCTASGEEAKFSAGLGAGTNAIPGFGFSYGQGGSQIAVSPTSHNFYVADKENFVVKAYQQDGEEAKFSAGPGEGTNELFGFNPCGVAVDANGDIYVANQRGGAKFNGAVTVYAPSGEELTSFETPQPCNLAVDSHGALYVDHYVSRSVEKLTPSVFPVSASTTYSAGSFFDAGPAYSVALDPLNDDLYVDRRPEAGHSLIAQRDAAGNLLGTFANPGEPGELVESEGLAVDGSSGTVYVSDSEGEASVGIFVPAIANPPVVEKSSVSSVTASSANVAAQVNPSHFNTHYRFQYLTLAAYEANGETFAGATETDEADLGSAGTPQSASAHLGSLEPDTTYVFRVLAENENNAGNPVFGSVVLGEEGEFHTFAAFPAGLPDGRAYEMVSPPAKGGEVFFPDPVGELGGSCEVGGVRSSECYPAGGLSQTTPMQSAPDGESVAYEGNPFFAGLSSAANQYLARRGPGGWATQGLSAPQFVNLSGTQAQGYMGFSPDLSRSVIFQISPALSPEAPTAGGKSFANIYLRSSDGSIEPLVTEVPPHRSPGGFCEIDCNEFQAVFAAGNAGTASSPDFSHLVFEANDALTGAVAAIAPAAPEVSAFENNLYEWSGGGLRLINVLPGNNAAAPGAVIGSGRLMIVRERETYDFDHAISADGSRVFWSEASGQAYVRIDGKETKEIQDHAGKFLTATPDGSKVLLNDGCLYDVGTEACEDLTQGEGGFQGILGAAEDLSRVYFVDTKALTPPSEENANGEHAVAGENNLYAWHEGVTTFIGALLGADNEIAISGKYGDWKPSSADRLAQVSSDGTHLAFMSQARLTGYDNDFRGGGECPAGNLGIKVCFEVFAYDANSGKLACASCNPTGLRPLGHSNLSLIFNEGAGGAAFPTASPLPQPNNLSTDGQGRLFFESQDTLSPRDTNGRTTDVYEWEPNGVGSCHRADGCVFLVSSGHALDDSFFVDSTPSGKDAFLISREQLTLADKNEQLDLFDARIGGGIAAAGETTRSECQGEACQPAGLIPDDKTPASSAFKGAGNVKAKQHKKKHKKQHKRHAKKRHHKRAANANRGGVK